MFLFFGNRNSVLQRILFRVGIITLCIIACFALFFEVKTVNGVSMYPAIRDGERILIFKFAYGLKLPFVESYILRWTVPKKGDTVIFRIDGRTVIKRVYAVAGEKIPYMDDAGKKYLTVSSEQIALTSEEFRTLCGNGSKAEVPANMFLALGDNFAFSEDSRHYGFVSYESVLGKVVCK